MRVPPMSSKEFGIIIKKDGVISVMFDKLGRRLKLVSYRTLALFLSVMVLLSLLDFSMLTPSAATSDGGFNISIKWNGSDQDPSVLESFSDCNETQLVRLKVLYENKEVTTGYQPGEIVITLPGIKDAVRSGRSYYPAAVAADEASESTKNYDWSYTYSSTSDTFTFTNNSAIAANSTFEGSFEIIWSLPSRLTKNGFSKDLQAKLRTAKNDQTASNVITYSQTRQPDAYTLRQEVSAISSAEGLRGMLPENTTEDDYTWVKYNVYGTDTYYARDVQGNERFDCWFLEGALVQGAGLNKTGAVQDINGKIYECWSVEKNITNRDVLFLKDIYVAYPNDKYKDQKVSSYVYLKGTYYDDTEESELADSEIVVNLLNFDFVDLPGNIYNIDKYAYGVYSSYINDHCNACYNYGAVNSTHIAEGMPSYHSRLSLYLNYDKDDADFYDLEFVDDIMDVMTTNGELRQLNDDEYNFTKVVIPSAGSVSNANGYAIEADEYEVEIYLRRAGGEFETTPYENTLITNSQQTVNVPEDTVGVKVLVKGVKESLMPINIYVYYRFHTSADDIRLDNGSVVNYMYFNIYDDKGTWINSEYDGNRDTYSSDREYNRDMELYGHTYDRETATLHIIEVPNEYYSTTTIRKTKEDKEAYYFTGEITDSFTIADGNSLSKFSVYTIVPEGMRLQALYNREDTLFDCLSFSASGYTSAYIKDHVSVEIIDNYKDSGRELIAIHYDFSDSPITTSRIAVTGIPMYYEKDLSKAVSQSFTMHSLTLIDQPGKWYANSLDNSTQEDGIWNDIDNDGDTGESAAYSYSNVTVLNPESSNLQFTKSVKTTLTNGYVQPAFDDTTNSYVEDEIPDTYRNYEYSYKLRLKTGENLANNIVFVDTLETGERAEWQGTFVRVDTSYAEKLLGTKPTVYYSAKAVDSSSKPDLSSSVWTTAKPSSVKSIAVDFSSSMMPSGSSLYIEIYMKSPANNDGALDYKITENFSHVYYDKYDAVTNYFIESQDLPSNNVPVSLIPFMGTIKILKTDSTNKEKLSGAVFSLYEMLGDEPDTDNDLLVSDKLTTDDSGTASIRVPYGSYYFIETAAPLGYKLDETPQKIVLDDNAPDISVTADIKNERKEGQLKLTKVSDRNTKARLSGAKFALYSADDKLLKNNLVTDANGELTVTGLEWGDYYVKELEAPTGYIISNEKVSFTVNAANDAYAALTVKNEQLPGTVILEKTEVLEDGTTKTGEPLDGAAYKLYDSDDKLIGTYMTDDNGKIYVDELTFGDYYFKESIASQGYVLNPNKIEFTIDGSDLQKDNTVSKTVKTTDTRLTGKLWLQKLDDVGDYVKNAEYALFTTEGDIQVDETGKPSDKVFTTNEEGIIEITGLYWGDYYIKETKSPLGYDLNDTKYPFVISRETVNNLITINALDPRGKGSIELTKVDEADESVTLEGAVYTLYKNDGTVYRDDLVTDENGILLVEEIEWGSYYFVEKTPPAGYGLSDEKIRFSVNYLTAGKLQKVTAYDPMITAELVVTKKIEVDDIVFAHGNPTFTFKLDGTDINGKAYTFYKNVTFNELFVSGSQGTDYVEQSVVFTDLPVGTWTVSEVETSRYNFGSAEAKTSNGTVDSANGTVKFVFDNTDNKGEAVFTNNKTVQTSTTHNVLAVNIAKTAKKLTAIVALWQGDDTVTSERLDRTQLDVYAVYDDGSQIKLADDAYTLDQEVFDGTMNGDYTVTATYSEGGKTYSDSFVLNLKLPLPFTWTVTEGAFDEDGTHYDGTAAITGYTGVSSVMSMPSKVNGIRTLEDYSTGEVSYEANGKTYKVTVVGDGTRAVYGAESSSGVILPSTVEVISDKAFYLCSNLTGTLTIPASVTTIGNYAFTACSGLSSLQFEDGSHLTTIGNYAFQSCRELRGILKIPSTVVSIGNYAFGSSSPYALLSCYNLSGLEFGENSQLKTIGSDAFARCEGLTGTLTIPASVTTIGYYAFGRCTNLSGLQFENDSRLERIGDYAFYQCSGFTGTLTIPASVLSIGGVGSSSSGFVFSDCSGFSSLQFEEGSHLTVIGRYAFDDCSGLTGTLTIPASVTIIGDTAFSSCSGLTGLDFEGGTKPLTIDSYAFSYCTSLEGELKIPANVTSIGRRVFYSCSGLTGLKLEGGTEPMTIGNEAFSRCTDLAGELKIPANVTSIGQYAFSSVASSSTYACKKLTGLVFEENSQLETIGDYAFSDATGLTGTLTIPANVKSIGTKAFYDCVGLKGLEFETGSHLTTIGDQAFQYCTSIRNVSVEIPASVKTIGGYAFAYVQMNSLTFENGSQLETIGDSAFYTCDSIVGTVTIPAGVTSVGSNAFSCGNLNLLRIPNTLTTTKTYGMDASKVEYYTP